MNFFRILIVAILVLIAWVVLSGETKFDSNENQPPAAESTEAVNVPETPPVSKGDLESVEIGSITPIHKHGDIYLAGQPSPEDLILLKEQGFKTILSLRKADELSWDQQAATQEQGMKFVHIPFQGVEELTPSIFDQVLNVLSNSDQQPILFHCGSSNRVSAIWYAHRVLKDGLAHEEALVEAKAAGLKTVGYVEKAREYVLSAQLLDNGEPEQQEAGE